MPKAIKTISSKLQKFVPSSSKGFSEGAKDIADRPMIIHYRLLGRGDKLNLQSLGGIVQKSSVVGDSPTLTRMGDVAKYIWENCVQKVENLILDEEPKEQVVGAEKDRLWYTEGMDDEIIETVVEIQNRSFLTEAETKN